jgi:hypothetical protein
VSAVTVGGSLGGLGVRGSLILVVAWLMVLFDGYDLPVLGAVLPAVREEWGSGRPSRAPSPRSRSSGR